MMQVFECDQGSPEWYAARLGIPTASEFHTVMAKGKDGGASKTRADYLRKLAGEVLTGEPMESYSNGWMERGKELEDEARSLYAFTKGVELQRVGFVRNGDAGCSPDSLIGADSGLEIKIALPHVQIERLQRGTLPPEHRHQVQGSVWLTGRSSWEFISYCPKLPPLIVTCPRDDGYIATIKGAVDQFNSELAELVDQIRNYGQRKEAA